MRIATVTPSYEGCRDLVRWLRYVELAEEYTRKYEPSWELYHHVELGKKIGDGIVKHDTWTPAVDAEIWRCRVAALKWGAERADIVCSVDTDVMIPQDYLLVMGYVRPDYPIKTAPPINVDSGRFRFVDASFNATYEWPPDRLIDKASENVVLTKDVIDREEWTYDPANPNEDYLLCAAVKKLTGKRIFTVPLLVTAT